MNRRRFAALMCVAVLALYPTSTTIMATAGSAEPSSHREVFVVRAVGSENFEANALIYSTFRFDPERSFPHTGDRVVLADRDASTGVPHTLTVVRKSELPTSIDEVFGPCPACNQALNAHFGQDPPRFRVGLGDGLNERGDSILVLEGQSVGARVTASSGSVLHFLCAIHPWMQGRLVVG
jgi:hypothetical protein